MTDRTLYFKSVAHVLPKHESRFYRNQYVEKFVNTSTDYYRANINVKQKFSDGECYTGYLWDTLRSSVKISFSELANYLPKSDKTVLVFWDIHSSDRIFVDNYWLFEKTDVIEISVRDLLPNLDLLQEDIYIFDRSLEWSVILTHESEGNEDWPASRIALRAQPVKSNVTIDPD